MVELSRYWKVKVWFNQEMDIQILPHKSKTADGWLFHKSHVHTDVHVFNRICYGHGNSLIYATTKKGRQGYYFPDLNQVVKYEPVIGSNEDKHFLREFKTYEQFKTKFDPFFITEAEIQKSWNAKSAQHGGRYKPSDFHKIGPQGKKVLADFLRGFKGISSTDPNAFLGYHTSDNNLYLEGRYTAYHHLGRDIKISHRAGNGFVWYSSEFSGCGNGRYGIVANKNEFLWCEDD